MEVAAEGAFRFLVAGKRDDDRVGFCRSDRDVGEAVVECVKVPAVVVRQIQFFLQQVMEPCFAGDPAEADAVVTGENREGMFFAARTFAFKMGQSLSMLLFTAFASIGPETGLGYRIAAIAATVICLLGALVLSGYNEERVMGIITLKKKPE